MEQTSNKTQNYNELHDALKAIVQQCNHAQSWDGAGFSKYDAPFGHEMYHKYTEYGWSPKQARAIWKMLKKYRKQLASNGIDFETLPEPEVPAESNDSERVIMRVEEGYFVSFRYHPGLVQLVKEIPGRKFDGNGKRWFVPQTSGEYLKAFAEQNQFAYVDNRKSAAA